MLKRPIYKWPQSAPAAIPSVQVETKAETKALPTKWTLPRPIEEKPSTDAETKTEVKPHTFEALPNPWLGKGGVADFLNYRDMAAWTITGRRIYSLFQPELLSARLVQHGIRGEQDAVKAILDRAKHGPWKDLLPKLLCEQINLTDFSARSFHETPLTLAQAVYFNKDWHLMDMLIGSKLALLAFETTEDEVKDGQLPFISQFFLEEARRSKTPYLIRTGKGPFRYFIYGYDGQAEKWQVIPLKLADDPAKAKEESKLLASLPFPLGDCDNELNEPVDCGAHLTPALRELVKQGHTLLEQYLPEEELAKQLLALRNNPIRYNLPLFTLPEDFNLNHASHFAIWFPVFESLSIQFNRPILIRCGKELRFFCYDYDTERWQFKSVDEPELFSELPFPMEWPLQRCGVFVRTSLDHLEARPIPPEVHLAFILIQPYLDRKPTDLYCLDQSTSEPSPNFIFFPRNQNLNTFLRALYPEVDNEAYPELPQLNEQQLAKAIQATGYAAYVIYGDALSEEQHAKLMTYHTQGTQYGLHCDERRLKEALVIHMANWWSWGEDLSKEYWCTEVRDAEAYIAAPTAYQYCQDKRSFYPIPDFAAEMSLQRKLEFWNTVEERWEKWFPLQLGQAIARCNIEGSASGMLNLDPFQVIQDFSALQHLDKVSTEYLVMLKQRLPKLAPTPALRKS